jgi:hypothetical protein
LPGDPTAPFTPTWDTGPFLAQPDPVKPLVAEPGPSASETDDIDSEPIPALAHPVAVPGAYQNLKRWVFVLVVAGVWIVAAAIGVGLFYWWYHAFDKTPPVFVVMLYLGVCTLASLLTAMVENKPKVSALSIALMSAPLASTAAAAALYGFYFCERASRCLVGVVPY